MTYRNNPQREARRLHVHGPVEPMTQEVSLWKAYVGIFAGGLLFLACFAIVAGLIMVAGA